MTLLSRRSLLVGLIAAPAIVRVQSIMPVRSIERLSVTPTWEALYRLMKETDRLLAEGVPLFSTAVLYEYGIPL
jgi:hypothetical protein